MASICVGPENQPIYLALLDKAASYPEHKPFQAKAFRKAAEGVASFNRNIFNDYKLENVCYDIPHVGYRIEEFIYEFLYESEKKNQPIVEELEDEEDDEDDEDDEDEELEDPEDYVKNDSNEYKAKNGSQLRLDELINILQGMISKNPENAKLLVHHEEFSGITPSTTVSIEDGRIIIS